MMWLRGVITGLALLACATPSAQASPAKGVTEPEGAKIALDHARQECLKARGLRLRVGPEAIRAVDLNGDGRPDYLVSWEHLICERSPNIYCGTGGCPLAIIVALPNGKFRQLFRQHVLRYEIEDGPGARTIRFDLHGTYCNGAGADPCSKSVRIGDKPFVFKQPL